MCKTFTDIPKQKCSRSVSICLWLLCMDFHIVNVFQSRFDAFDKSLVEGMLGGFGFNNQFITLVCLICRLIEKTCVRLSINVAIAMST